jgi:hypothetical protein
MLGDYESRSQETEAPGNNVVASVDANGSLIMKPPWDAMWSPCTFLPEADTTIMIAVTPTMKDTLDVLRSRLGAYGASDTEVTVFAIVEFARRLTALS